MSTVIKIENLGKQYRLGQIGTGTVSHDLNRWWAKIRGKEDPFLKIGETNDRTTKGNSDYVWALRNINFSVNQGDVLGVIGRNGAGKSTLLKILSRTTLPTVGSLKVKGRIASLLEVGTGFHPELSGRDNIFQNGALLGMTKKEIVRKFDEIVDFSGVERYIDTPVKRYSSGMYVRLAFAVAAHLESEILIVDEVLAVGDAEFQKKCLGKMGDVSKKEGRTVLFVSHNIAAIQNLCDKGIILSSGLIKFDGNAGDAINEYISSNYDVSKPIVEIAQNNSPIQFNKLYLSDESNNIRKDYRLGESVFLRIDYEVREPLKGSNFCMILKRNGVEVLCSFDCDEDESNLIKNKTGQFSYLIKLPTDILKAGVYSISIDAGLVGIGILNKYDDIITFDIDETNEVTSAKGYAESRVGILYKKINWKKI